MTVDDRAFPVIEKIAKELPSEAHIGIAYDLPMRPTDPIETTLELLRSTRKCVRKSEEHARVLRDHLNSTMRKIRRSEMLLLRSDAAIRDFTALWLMGRDDKNLVEDN